MVLERAGELRNRSWGNHGVRVEEDEDLASPSLRSEVRRARKAEVLAGRQDTNPVPATSIVDLRASLCIVDDDNLVGLARERVEAAPERRAGPVGDDDDACSNRRRDWR
jgi:hypothetical protein